MIGWLLSGKESACQLRRCGFDAWSGKIPWKEIEPIPGFLSGEPQWKRSLVGYSLWGGRVRLSDWTTTILLTNIMNKILLLNNSPQILILNIVTQRYSSYQLYFGRWRSHVLFAYAVSQMLTRHISYFQFFSSGFICMKHATWRSANFRNSAAKAGLKAVILGDAHKMF